MTRKNDDLLSQLKPLGIVTTVPVILLVGPAVGFWIGGWIDRKFHIYPWFTTILIILGAVASGREVFRLLKQLSKDDAENK